MPEHFDSPTLINSNVLERLANDGEKPALVLKQQLMDNIPLKKPATTEILRPGTWFIGTQSSQSNKYQVRVQLQDVDINDSFACGYLTIDGLTDEYPSLTTFFEAEIIGEKHNFQTRKWDANLDNDIEHWGKFDYWNRRFKKDIYREVHTANPHVDPYIFMRWKEQFLVPDHHIRQVNGASYSGFYYTCLEVATGTIDGYYFHNNSERFQQLQLECDRQDTSASFEYR